MYVKVVKHFQSCNTVVICRPNIKVVILIQSCICLLTKFTLKLYFLSNKCKSYLFPQLHEASLNDQRSSVKFQLFLVWQSPENKNKCVDELRGKTIIHRAQRQIRMFVMIKRKVFLNPFQKPMCRVLLLVSYSIFLELFNAKYAIKWSQLSINYSNVFLAP